ncbi:hypothetical protein CHS0354_036884 [Potamilus streckersoni]|uniref:Ig-like domain-containing protein n=1 Tax=Potamilus streckersoni TaxID=2493646 RepID=A0AAE0W4V1_9BIVA|nr:hypothetical protein CHS0354_036884 [Potamilus streckersoni]
MDCRARTKIIFLIFNVIVCQSRICPRVRIETDGKAITARGDQKMLTSNDVRMEYVRVGHYLTLECCSSNYDIITWYRWNKSAGMWMDYLPCNADEQCSAYKPDIIEEGQVLEIKEADVSAETSYKCIVKSNNNFIQRNFQVNVVACDELARGPFAIYPNPEDLYIKSFGEDVTFPCVGYFGCNDGDFGLVEWFIKDGNSDNWIDASSIGDNRYNVTFFTRSGSSIRGANLSISRVQKIDLRRKFRCVLANAQVMEGQTNIDVQIQIINSTDTDKKELLVAVFALSTSLVFIIVLLSIALIMRYCHRRKKNSRKASLQYRSNPVYHPTRVPMVLDGKSEDPGSAYILNNNNATSKTVMVEQMHSLLSNEPKSISPV